MTAKYGGLYTGLVLLSKVTLERLLLKPLIQTRCVHRYIALSAKRSERHAFKSFKTAVLERKIQSKIVEGHSIAGGLFLWEVMRMTITIPVWTLWVIGVPISIVTIGFAIVGGMFLWSFKDWKGWY